MGKLMTKWIWRKAIYSCIASLVICLVGCVNKDSIYFSDDFSIMYQESPEFIDLEYLADKAVEIVDPHLPNAYMTSMTFSGEYSDLHKFHGQVHFNMIQINRRLLGDQVLMARVSINTLDSTATITINDETQHYPNRDVLTEEDVLDSRAIADIAYGQILLLDIENCDVLLGRGGRNPWQVACTVVGSGTLGERICHFSIDPFTGEVSDYHISLE